MPSTLMTDPQTEYADGFGPAPKNSISALLKHPVKHLLGLSQLEQIYRRRPIGMSPRQFARFTLRELDVDYQVLNSERASIPKTGSLVMVANHPFGAIEGVVLADLLTEIRPDVKFMATEMLACIPELSPLMIPVNPFGGKEATRSNVRGMRAAAQWVKNGGALVVFPSGTVANLHLMKGRVMDPAWSPTIARLIRKTGATMQAIHIEGRNTLAFQAAGIVHPRLRTMLLPRQLLNKQGSTVRLHIGNPIGANKIDRFPSDEELIQYLRFRSFLVSHRSTIRKRRPTVHRQAVAEAIPTTPLERDLEGLPEHAKLFSQREFSVYHASAREIPNILKEIGRLREVTFRACGEGTGRSTDLDDYDGYYQHLFAWDHKAKQIVGAYRMASIQENLRAFGPKGLYVNELFRISPEFYEKIGEGLELGRSFLQEAYQRHPMALFLLWRGIGQYLVKRPKHRVLLGPVSISNDYHPVSLQILAKFMREHLWNRELANLVSPQLSFAEKVRDEHAENILSRLNAIDEISELVAEVDPSTRGMPVLLRHYLKIGGKILALSRDPDFADVLDALTIVNMDNGDPRIITRYLGKEGARRYMQQQR